MCSRLKLICSSPSMHPDTLVWWHIEILNDSHMNMYIDHYRCDTHVGFDLIHTHKLEIKLKLKVQFNHSFVIKCTRSDLTFKFLSTHI